MKKVNEPYRLETEVKFRQWALLTLTSLCLLFSLLFLVFEFSGNTLFVFIIFLITMTAFNYFASKLFSIKLDHQTIKIENMWKKFTIPLDELLDISSAKTIIPYPFNPYVRFTFRRRKPIITILERPTSIYFSRGGINKYIADIKMQFSL